MKLALIIIIVFALLFLSCHYSAVVLEPGRDYHQNGANIMRFSAMGYAADSGELHYILTQSLRKMSADKRAEVCEITIDMITESTISGSFWFYYPSQNWPFKVLPSVFVDQNPAR